MGKSTINDHFSIAMLVYQRVYNMDKPQKQGAKKTLVDVSSVSPMRNAMFQYTPCLDNQIKL